MKSLFETTPVYCDQPIFKWCGQRWAHLFSPSLVALHDLAHRIGLRRAWFQEPPRASWPHYDINERRRLAALRAGALPVDRYFCIEVAGRLTGQADARSEARWARIRERRAMGGEKHFGITGTQTGATHPQVFALGKLMAKAKASGFTHFHHGDCVGADAQAHAIALGFGFHVVVHPPEDEGRRAFCEAPTILKPRPYLLRNGDLVEAVHVLIGVPAQAEEQLRSGTWSTIRKARKAGKRHYVLNPDGSVILVPEAPAPSLFGATSP